MEIRLETIEIAVDGDKISGTVLTPAARLPGVLFVHGWGGGQEHDLAHAREAAGLGCVCLTFDLRGHEANAGQHRTVSRAQNLRDVIAAYDTLLGQPNVDPAAIAVVGNSYGGYLASILTTLRPVRWLALRSPALYRDEAWQSPKCQLHRATDLHAYRRGPIATGDNRALRACAAFRGDALVVESQFDEIVPHPVIGNYLAALANAGSLTSRVLPGADHGLSHRDARKAYGRVLRQWRAAMVVVDRAGVAPARRDQSRQAGRPRGRRGSGAVIPRQPRGPTPPSR
jgi:dienelactone hydrolase